MHNKGESHKKTPVPGLAKLTKKQEWGVIRNKLNQVVGVRSLSNESPTIYAKILSFRGGAKYSDWKFTAD